MTSILTIGRRDMLRASLMGSAAALIPSAARAALTSPSQTSVLRRRSAGSSPHRGTPGLTSHRDTVTSPRGSYNFPKVPET